MPIYEYECSECGHKFEIKQGFEDDPLKTCPECNKDSLCKLISKNVSAHYKGPGFATTEARGITGRKRKPNIKVRMATEEEKRNLGQGRT